ncbi:Os01g0650200, partial [Oryza sativa Japonica Group]
YLKALFNNTTYLHANSNHVYFTDCNDMMNQSLFLVGEIGGNDYNHPLMGGVSIRKIRSFTPSIIAKISSTITVSNMPMDIHTYI